MKKLLPHLCWALAPFVAAGALAQTGDGYVGIYQDSLGTQACASVPSMTGTTLYVIAKTAGQSASGIAGAEFRIEVTSPSGWNFTYNAPSTANIVLGNPIDTDPDPDAGGGVNLGFPSCQVPDGNGRVKLGTLSVFNQSGSPTNLLVKRHSQPTNAGFACPLFVECDDPYYTMVCMTASPPDSCSLGVQKAAAVSSADPIIFTAALNTVQSGPPPDLGRHAARVVVWFKPGVVDLPEGRTAATVGEASFVSSTVQSTLAAIGAQQIQMLTPTATLENLTVTDAAGTRPLDRSQLDMYRVTLADTNVSAAVSALGVDADVLEASPDHVRHAMLVPNDSLFSKEWWLRNTGLYNGVVGADLDAAPAWDRIAGLLSLPVDVVVIDTGVDAGHPELASRVNDGPNYTGGGPPDDDAPGSHGTSVAGIVGAQGNNTIGAAGVDWNARIVRIKALYADGGGYMSDVDAAVDWARVRGYRILNLSLGGYGSSGSERVVFKNAYMANMAVFAAMGNDNGRTTVYPAAYSPFTIAVGAMMHKGVRWDDTQITDPWFVPDPNTNCYPCGSNTGPHIRFVAPGGRFIETTRSRATGSYWEVDPTYGLYGFGGTSAATPVAAGLAALVQSLETNLTGEDLAEVLSRKADDLPGTPTGWDDQTGSGAINADLAVAFVSGQNKLEQGTITSVADVGTVNGGNRTIYGWPGITDGTYLTYRHTIQGTATFSQPFVATPTVWPRQASSYGADTENPIQYSYWTPQVRVLSVNSTQVTFEAYVYDLREQHYGSHVAWWPTTPSGVCFAYTAIGPVPVTDVDEISSTRPLQLAVAPIPARSSAQLEFSLAKSGETNLAIYDVAGRLVRRLVAQRLEPGAHSYGWDLRSQGGQPVGSGVYFARLNTLAGTRVTRLVVLR
jgi:subtilisin family serine protease